MYQNKQNKGLSGILVWGSGFVGESVFWVGQALLFDGGCAKSKGGRGGISATSTFTTFRIANGGGRQAHDRQVYFAGRPETGIGGFMNAGGRQALSKGKDLAPG
jgi:hypothetical protein